MYSQTKVYIRKNINKTVGFSFLYQEFISRLISKNSLERKSTIVINIKQINPVPSKVPTTLRPKLKNFPMNVSKTYYVGDRIEIL